MRSHTHHRPRPSRRAGWLFVVAALAACQGADAPATPIEPDGVDESAATPKRVIVVLAPKSNAAELARQHGIQAEYVYSEVLSGFTGTIAEAARAGLLRDHRVVRVVPDEEIQLENTQPNPTWGIDRVDQRALPLDKAYSWNYTGAGVTAYIFDTGIRYDHAEFEGRAVPGYDAWGGTGEDCHGHGTHVAGTVGGRSYGVAKQVKLVAVRVLNCNGAGTTSTMLAGIDWVLKANRGPAVANFSLGGGRSETLNQAVRNLVAAGIHTAVAAGNNAGDACERSPASTAEAITVGATTSSDTRASYSNWGSCVDVFAPGSGIVSASHASSTGTATKSGTSMAAPHAAGVAALYLHENPSLTGAQLHGLVVANATRNAVKDAQSANAHLVHSLRGAGAPPPPEQPRLPTAPPAAPAALTIKLQALNKVQLSWSDRSSDEQGFAIERRHGSGAWTTLIEVGANTTAYTDQSVLRNESYTYRIRAFNAAGSSAASNEVGVTIACKTKGKSQNCA